MMMAIGMVVGWLCDSDDHADSGDDGTGGADARHSNGNSNGNGDVAADDNVAMGTIMTMVVMMVLMMVEVMATTMAMVFGKQWQ